MRNSNIYKFTVTEYMQNPPSCGGNWECGETTYVYMSRSAKRARFVAWERSGEGAHMSLGSGPEVGRSWDMVLGSEVVIVA